MEQYISKSALVAEIKERIETYKKGYANGDDRRADALEVLLHDINTLEVKEVDLEEKATLLSQKYFPNEENIWARPNIEAQRCKSACIEMVEWFKTQKRE